MIVPAESRIGDLIEARSRSLDLVADLSDEQLMGPRLAIVNPLRWEIGHLAWFQEKWMLRRGGGRSVLERADELYDSAAVPHDRRWDLDLPSRHDTLAYMHRVLGLVRDRLDSGPAGDEDLYFLRLVTFHEDMHAEAFLYTRQTLSYPPPGLALAGKSPSGGGPWPGDAAVPGGTIMLGAEPDEPFVFDNEKWAHPVELKPFRIARAAVTNQEFAAFVEDRGYERREIWSEKGWAWRERSGARHPVYWTRGSEGRWLHRRFDRIVPLEPHFPVIHVSWYEAEAYCRWADRRLPTEAEWEAAAAGGEPGRRKRRYPWGDAPPGREQANLDGRALRCVPVDACPGGDGVFGCRQLIGNVWEWTAGDFEPYPGFVADPYKEYSKPWFGTHKVLRGGCWATRGRLLRNTWRNFYTPDRRDVFAGFRTCAR
ncbi:MAG: ergothioneine biosynthesis protein EgtB [Planctomycetes bacterium]|nr:ergothioneine biosynthesis protein EgtB [Planctomycetota bacterium]